MAKDSKRVRRLRRLKRDRTMVLKMLDHALNERNVYRDHYEREMSSKLRPDLVQIVTEPVITTTVQSVIEGETIGYLETSEPKIDGQNLAHEVELAHAENRS